MIRGSVTPASLIGQCATNPPSLLLVNDTLRNEMPMGHGTVLCRLIVESLEVSPGDCEVI